jgi:glycyl-tRNA synthetase beta chain
MAANETAPLLVELLVEELPPKALKALGNAFASAVHAGLAGRDLASGGAAAWAAFATPRRLGVFVESVTAKAPSRSMTVKLMPAAVGLSPDGRATAALLKRLAALGADASVVPQLERRVDGKNESLFYATTVPGASIEQGLQAALDEAISTLPIPKVMQYQLADGWTTVSFVRPAHGLVALHGNAVVPVRALGLQAGRTTRGHRFEGSASPITLRSAASYAEQLRDEGAVLVSFDGRRAEIVRQLETAAAREDGLTPVADDALLDEVTGLVEKPNVLVCEFEKAFLGVPSECLILTMKANQKYFPLLDAKGALSNRFLVVSNISPSDPGRVIEGNERVVRPRLADAKFFFDQDRKKKLEERVAGLDHVVYHARLGSQGERVRRIRAIARWVAERIGASVADADRAAELSKADLLTDMVGEFPELQGIMGGYYAEHDGERPDVVQAIKAQYVNRRSEEDEATNLVGVALLLADRIESIVGIWGIGLKPTGEKDPYALRRHALTVIHAFSLLTAVGGTSGAHRLSLRELLEYARSTFATDLAADTVAEVEDFIYERLANQLATRFDVRAVGAVMAQRPPLQEVEKRLEAVRDFQKLDEAVALAAANKRVANILRKSEDAIPAALDATLLGEREEIALNAALLSVARQSGADFEAGDYAASLRALAELRDPVDAFFDHVMVNVDDPMLRGNRLALLARLHAAMNRVADLSRLAN